MIWRSGIQRVSLNSGIRLLHSSTRVLAIERRDEAIRARLVRLVDPESGSLSPHPERTVSILRNFDRTKYWLVQVKAGKLDTEEEDGDGGGMLDSESPMKPMQSSRRKFKEEVASRNREMEERTLPVEELAIVKLVSKKDTYDKQKAIKAGKKQGTGSIASSATAYKQTDLSWSSTDHDVQHKLKAILAHFKKRGSGAKATVTIRAKKGKGREGGMNMEGKRALIKRVDEYLCKWDEGEEAEEEGGGGKPDFHARQAAPEDWKQGQTTAVMQFEVIKGRAPEK